MPIRVSPSSPSLPEAASRSASTRSTMSPIVRQPQRSSLAAAVPLISVAHHAAVCSNA